MSAERFFDDLARTLAEPMPRRRAVRVIGASIAAVAVPGVSPRTALAHPTSPSQKPPPPCPRGNMCCTRTPYDPKGQIEQKVCGYPMQRYSCDGLKCLETCPPVNPVLKKRQKPCWSAETWPDGIPKRYNCCLQLESFCDDGECVPNCLWPNPNAGLVQCGRACCPSSEYCCDRIFTTKVPFCCAEEAAFKEPWKDAEVASMIALVALGALAVATGGLAAIAIAGLAAGAGLGGVASKIAGDDPPDSRYKELFRPRVPRVTPVRVGDGISPAAARALNSLIESRLRSGAYILAWIRSIEKAQGADKARDKSWAKRQRKAAAGYARQAAATLERDRSLGSAALRELKRGGFVDTGVSLAQARQALQQVRRQGLPAEMMRALRTAGVEDPRIAEFRSALSRLDPKLAVGVGAFGGVTDPRLAAANTAAIKALRKAGRA